MDTEYEDMCRTLFYASVDAEFRLRQAAEMLREAQNDCNRISELIKGLKDSSLKQAE